MVTSMRLLPEQYMTVQQNMALVPRLTGKSGEKQRVESFSGCQGFSHIKGVA